MEKHVKIINFIKALIIIAVAVLVVAGLSKLLVLKSEDGINQFDALYKQPEDSIDVIFLGSSKVYCDIATGVLWDNYGIASFDLGGAEAPAWVSYYQLKEALRTQKPKVVCYEVSIAAMYPTLYQSDEWASDNSYGMKWNSNRIDQLRVNSEDSDYYTRLNPFNIVHGRYNDLSENDFRNVRSSAKYKGFDPREMIVESNRPDISTITETEPCTQKAEEYIRKIIELCRSEGIEPVLFASPYEVPEDEQKVMNYIWTVADSEGVDYIDFNGRYDEMGLDFSVDIASGNHLSFTGNYKFSDYFGSVLRDKYNVPDRRGDSKYVSWDWDSSIQAFQRNDLEIKKAETAEEILLLARDGYVIFAVQNGKGFIIENGEIVKEADPGFRLSKKYGNDTLLLVDEGEAWESGSHEDHFAVFFVNDEEHREYFGNILFVYDTVRHEYVGSLNY